MSYLELFYESFGGFIEKMCAMVTDQNLWATKPCHNVFKYESCSGIDSEIPYRFVFSPSGDIIHCYDDVVHATALSKGIDRKDKINIPFFKILKGHLGMQGHFIST